MLKWIAGAVLSAMGIAALAGPLTDAIKPDNAATKLVQAAGRANNQAGDLGSSYADIVPITDEEGNPTQQETPQTPDPRYEEYTSQAEHEVRDAMTFLNELQEQTGPVRQTQYISAVRQLKAAWQPRYDRAAADYKVFAYRIHHTEKMAKEYFRIQADLTGNIANPTQRRQSDEQDQRELEVYLQWRSQAQATLEQARGIKRDLDDLNIIIAKMELSANFAALYQDFQELPASMLSLHSEIGQFRQESRRISQTFGPSAFMTAYP